MSDAKYSDEPEYDEEGIPFQEYPPLSEIYGASVVQEVQRSHQAKVAPGSGRARPAKKRRGPIVPPAVNIPDFSSFMPPLTVAEWLARDLPAPDRLLGDWLTTTTRALLVGPTGLGKSNFILALGMACAAGAPFLHWQGQRPARVLYIDGEMSRRLLRQRLADAARRCGASPPGFLALSHEDIEGFAPLNTPAGQATIDKLIEAVGGVDLILFDAIMCLLAGDPREPEAWQQLMPWVRSLTKRSIGQGWLHHTGHDTGKAYGDKTREWQLDTVLHMEAVDHPETDISFNLEFRKARERTPDNRSDFATTHITLIDDVWRSDAKDTTSKGRVSPLGLKFLDALRGAIAGDERTAHGRPAASLDAWKAEAEKLGLIDPHDKPASARSLFNKHKRELIAANHVASNEERAWTV